MSLRTRIRKRIFPVVSTLVVLVLAIVFRAELVAWFTGKPMKAPEPPPNPAEHHHHDQLAHGSGAVPLDQVELPAAALETLRAVFEGYESLRAALAADQQEPLADTSTEVVAKLRAAVGQVGAEAQAVALALERAATAAEGVGAASDLEAARKRFGELSEQLVAIAAADPRLQEGWHIFRCPMTGGGFEKWFQRGERLENPYMGKRMLMCGSRADWSVSAPPPKRTVSGEIAHYTCPMHPSVKQKEMGACPLCGMDLTPVSREDLESGVVIVDEARRQRINMRTGKVARRPMSIEVKALGRVAWDESALTDVTLRLGGFIEELHVDSTGRPVRKGEPLFTVYSSELLAAQQEYLLAVRGEGAGGENSSLAKAARQRLILWGMTPGQIAQIQKRGEPMQKVPFLSPASGFVIEKNVVEGAGIEPGARLYRIAPLERVWVEAELFEHDFHLVARGQRAQISLPMLPGEVHEGEVDYVYPSLDPTTRTGRARIVLTNAGGALRPEMFAEVVIRVDRGERLQVSEEAVVYTGPRRLVFVDVGDERLEPREVKLGLKANGAFEVLDGLKEGEVVVTSGNFLVAAESRLRGSAEVWEGGEHGSH